MMVTGCAAGPAILISGRAPGKFGHWLTWRQKQMQVEWMVQRKRRQQMANGPKTQYYAAASLDGFIATEDDSLEWLFPLGNANDTSYPAFIAGVGALAMGSATYEWMLSHADEVAAETGSPWPYAQPAWIFSSRTLPTMTGANTRFVRGDVRPVHAEMSAAAGSQNIWIVGGGDLAGQFFDAGLLDELIVQVASVTLGKGKPHFPRRLVHPPLRLESVQQFGLGFAELRYQVPKGAA
jgi:dihydrofolate reductase